VVVRPGMSGAPRPQTVGDEHQSRGLTRHWRWPTAESIVTSAREAQSTLVTASSDAANHVKSLATDVERTLTAVGADTAASVLNSAREAQSSLHATSSDAASQIKAISADIERSLSVVTANTTDNIQSSALNAQSALVAASNEASRKGSFSALTQTSETSRSRGNSSRARAM